MTEEGRLREQTEQTPPAAGSGLDQDTDQEVWAEATRIAFSVHEVARALFRQRSLEAHYARLEAEVAAGRHLYEVALAWWEAQAVEFPTEQQVYEKEIGSFVKMIDAIEAYPEAPR